MEKALNKILDAVIDMSLGLSSSDISCGFLRGYLFALEENKEITRSERMMLIRFYDRLVAELEGKEW